MIFSSYWLASFVGSGESGPYPCAFGTFLSDSSTVGTKAARGVGTYAGLLHCAGENGYDCGYVCC